MVVPVEVPGGGDQELFIQLRNTFLENLNSNGNYDDYEEADIDRIRNDDNYCKRFIRQKRSNFQNALEMVDESLRWRKSFGVKDVNMGAIPLEFFQAKAVFPYNKDKEDNPIKKLKEGDGKNFLVVISHAKGCTQIMILVRYHKKASEFAKELRRFVIYWVELMEEQTNGGHMTVIMSCEGAGLSNLDLDLIKFLITLFRSYYPDSLAHILIYEMPWILNPAWKIIKAWLPEDFVDKIKFVNKTTIREYITAENLSVEMGGTDATEYIPPTEEDMKNARNATEAKRVHFSHNPETISGHKGMAYNREMFYWSKVATENGISRPSQVVITDDYTVIGGILKISPATILVFNPPSENATNDVVIKLSSVSDKTISYKVKTNNIESYRVKPSLGIIEPGNSIEINVVLLSGYQPQLTDKFLIMAMEISDSTLTIPALNTVWKSSPSRIISDHKLKCVLKKDDRTSSEESEIEKSLKNITRVLSNLEKKMQSLETKQTSLHFKQVIMLCLLVFFIFIFFSHICVSTEFSWSAVLPKHEL